MLNRRHLWICANCVLSLALMPHAFARTWTRMSGDSGKRESAGQRVGAFPIGLPFQEDREFISHWTEPPQMDGLALAQSDRPPPTSWRDFDFGPRQWTIARTATRAEEQIQAEIVSDKGKELWLKVASGGLKRVNKTEISEQDRAYVDAYHQAMKLRGDDIGRAPDLRVWRISTGDRSLLEARLDHIDADAVILQSRDRDLRMPFASLPKVDQQYVRDELARRGVEIPDAWKPVETAIIPQPEKPVTENHGPTPDANANPNSNTNPIPNSRATSHPPLRPNIQNRLAEARREAEQQRVEVQARSETVRISPRSYRGMFKLAVALVLLLIGGVAGFIKFLFGSGNSRQPPQY